MKQLVNSSCFFYQHWLFLHQLKVKTKNNANDIYEESRKGVIVKKKKIILIFAIFIFSTSLTKVESSTNLDITNDTTIKYKWYIEEKVEGMYYPKGESLEGYYEDINDIKYGKESDLDEKYCQYSRDKYVVTMDVERIYKKIIDAQYVKIIGLSEDTNIRILQTQLK